MKTQRSASLSFVLRHRAFAAPAVVVLCTLMLLVGGARYRPIASLLPEPSGRQPYRAYVFFQPADCAGNLEFLRILARPKFRSTVAVIGILSGSTSAGEAAGAAQKFRDLTGRATVLPSPRKATSALTALGYRKTPFVIVLDPSGQVRLASAVPGSFEESRRFERQLLELTHAPTARGSRS